MKVVRRIDFDASDGKLEPDSIKGERVLWSEYLEFRALVVRDNEAGAIVMASQGYGSFDVSIAASDIAVTDKIVTRFAKVVPAVSYRDRAGVTARVLASWQFRADEDCSQNRDG